MKKILKIMLLSQLMMVLTMGQGFCFLFEIKPISAEEIQKVDDEMLKDIYIDVMIELEAVNKFYDNTGLKPRELKRYKELLRYRTDLILEFDDRKLTTPRIK